MIIITIGGFFFATLAFYVITSSIEVNSVQVLGQYYDGWVGKFC